MISSNMVEQISQGGLQENFLSLGRYLSESKWSEFCEDKEFPVGGGDVSKYGLAVMLENTQRFISSLDETTRAVAIGDQR